MGTIFTILILLLSAALLSNFVLRPRRAEFWSGNDTFRIVDGHLEIERSRSEKKTWRCPVGEVFYGVHRSNHIVEINRAPSSRTVHTGTMHGGHVFVGTSHTTHSPGGSWTEKGSSYQEVFFTRIDQADTNHRLLVAGDPPCFGFGVEHFRYRNREIGNAKHRLEMHGLAKASLFSWLSRNGVSRVPDETRAEANFRAKTASALAHYRACFGFVEGDLDHLRFDENLEPITYALLDKADQLTIHHFARTATMKEPAVGFNYTNSVYYEVEHKVRLLSADMVFSRKPFDAVAVIVSSDMADRIRPLCEAAGKKISYWDHT